MNSKPALTSPGLYERIEGGLIGLLVGDALGVPYEFSPRATIATLPAIEMIPPESFIRAHSGVHPGTWSDDGAQALCLAASLLDRGELSLEDLGIRLIHWVERGYMTPDDKVFDCGNTTRAALTRLASGVPPMQSGGSSAMSNGNGSVMRLLPLALWHRGNDDALIHDAHQQSLPTHGHPLSQVACAWLAMVARGYLVGLDDPWDRTLASLRRRYEQRALDGKASHRDALDMFETASFREQPTATTYVIDTLWTVRHCMRQPTYEAVVTEAIRFGGDTDTVACIAGGLAGTRDGVRAIPPRWREKLRGRDIYQPIVDRYIERARHAVQSASGAKPVSPITQPRIPVLG